MNQKQESVMNIGEVAKLSMVNAKMIRRYEEQGIIPKASRTFAGYRQYSEKDVHILRFVKRARELGFSMKDTKQLLGLWKNQNRSNSQVKSLAQKHKAELEEKLNEIQAMISTLDVLIKHCHGDSRPDCPILQELECHKGRH
jgi:Cu(I)-responsive transcriptional regulator